MILIISQHADDISTNCVIDWLYYKKAAYTRINGRDLECNQNYRLSINPRGDSLQFRDKEQFNFKDIKTVWYRRWVPAGFYKHAEKLPVEEKLKGIIRQYLIGELTTLEKLLCSLLSESVWLSDYRKMPVNKLDVLRQARDCGLQIPETLVSNSRDEVRDFYLKNGNIIVKCLYEVSGLTHQNTTYVALTSLLHKEDIDALPEIFFPSLFQECIEKVYELRVFYLDGRCYPMAIFSQNDEQTKIDFRNYNFDRPNRSVPYKLPADIECNLQKLMKQLGLNTGSIDFIKQKNGSYIFLEVNPVGQFGMVSRPCNYFLEEKIADFLITNSQADESIER